VAKLFGQRYEGDTPQGPCLFVSRETGAGGSEIARVVAERLGWELLDKEILDHLNAHYGTPATILNVVDEKKVNWLADIFNGWIVGHGFSQLAYVHRLHRLFEAVARQGNVVIVGRGARFILPRSAGFSVRLIAPFDYRVRQVVLRQGLSTNDARAYVKESDRQRTAFLEGYFHHDVSDPHIHDLVVNVERLGIESALTLIVDGVKSWLGSNNQEPPFTKGAGPAKISVSNAQASGAGFRN
jgi:cytidylate kinase